MLDFVFIGDSDDDDFPERISRLSSGLAVELSRDGEMPGTTWEFERTGDGTARLRCGDDAWAELLAKMVWT